MKIKHYLSRNTISPYNNIQKDWKKEEKNTNKKGKNFTTSGVRAGGEIPSTKAASACAWNTLSSPEDGLMFVPSHLQLKELESIVHSVGFQNTFGRQVLFYYFFSRRGQNFGAGIHSAGGVSVSFASLHRFWSLSGGPLLAMRVVCFTHNEFIVERALY